MKRKRRAAGEGTLVRRRDGRWAAALSVGGRRRWVYGRTQAEALQRLRQLQLARPPRPGSPMSLGEYLERWLASCQLRVRPTTLYAYRHHVRQWQRLLGHVRLDALGPHQVQHGLDAIAPHGLEAARKAYRVLHRALEQAVEWDLLPSNPAARVRPPKAPYRDTRVWTPQQAAAFLWAARHDRYWGVYVLALTTGLRLGEILGLRWQDVDLQRCTLTVRVQLVDIPGLHLAEPKSAAARRTVWLPDLAVRAIEMRRKQAEAEGTLRNPLDLVWTDTRGHPVRRSNLYRRHFVPLQLAAGVPRIRFHDLRHTAATMMLEQGVHLRAVQAVLGHASAQLTLGTYAHALPAATRAAVERVAEALRQHPDNTGEHSRAKQARAAVHQGPITDGDAGPEAPWGTGPGAGGPG